MPHLPEHSNDISAVICPVIHEMLNEIDVAGFKLPGRTRIKNTVDLVNYGHIIEDNKTRFPAPYNSMSNYTLINNLNIAITPT